MVISFRRWREPYGWTLIELTIVTLLITTLSTIALVGYRSAITRSREAVLKEDLFRMRDALDQYYADKQVYPTTLDMLVSQGYIRAIPQDPFTGRRDSWEPVLAEIDPADPISQGIFDVQSSAEGTALDGSMYADW